MNSFLDKMRSWIRAHAPEWCQGQHGRVGSLQNLTMPEQKKVFGNKTRQDFLRHPSVSRQQAFNDYNYVLGYMKYAYDNG